MSFTYLSILNEMNDTAFKYCTELLYSELDFEVLKPENIRRIDLAEAIYRKQKRLRGKSVNNTPDDFYCAIGQIKMILNHHVNCKDGSKSAKYWNKTIKQIKALTGKESDDLETYEDIVKSYLCLLRQLVKDFESHKELNGISFAINQEDFSVIEKLKKHKFTVDDEKKVGPIRTKKGTVEAGWVKITTYIVTVLLFVRILQFEGNFVEKDEGDKDNG